MAYSKIPAAAIKGAIEQYGRNSTEHQTILHMADARLPYESVAELLQMPVDAVKYDLIGDDPLPESEHYLLHNCLSTIIPIGISRGLLPCKDTALTTEILRVIVEILGLQREITNLQTQLTPA